MSAIGAITASSEAVGFPAANLTQYDPDLIWKAGSFLSTIYLVIDLTVSAAIDHIWLNNANFFTATIEANPTNVWTAPAFSKAVTLASDDIGIIKGFFDLTSTNYRYVRITIPTQSLTDGGTVPQLGNVVIGTSEYLLASTWEPTVDQEYDSFTSDGGSYSEESKGKARHVFATSMLGETKANIDAAPLNGWSAAVIFTDLGSVADSYLVYSPKGKQLRVRSQIDCDLSYTLRELV